MAFYQAIMYSLNLADRRNRRFYRRRGPPRQPRQTQQDSQGEDKTEGTEGVFEVALLCT